MMDRTPTPADADPHAETLELLPWLANGTLAGAELERVEAHLARCPACRARLDWERGLRGSGVSVAPPLSATLAFARLSPRLGAQEGGAGMQVRWSRLAAANDPRWLRSVAAVQLGVIFVLGLVIVWPGGHQAGDAARDMGRYSTLGARAAAPGNLVVSFDPATPERELRRILLASGARIVDGPTAAGAYVLDVAAGEAGPTLSSLRAEPAVVLAEPLTDGGR
jgi:anti-sigma factor RsiW